MALGEALTFVVQYEIAVVEGGNGKPKGTVEQDLASSGFEEIFAADDFGDGHFGVVDGDCELVRGDVVAAPDDKVAEVTASSEGLWAEMLVDESDSFAVWHAEAPVNAGWFGEVCGVGAAAAFAGIDRLVIEIVGRRGRLRKIFAGAGAGIDCAGIAEFAPCIEIKIAALTLQIRGVRAAAIGAFGPAEAEPAQVFHHGVGELGAAALGVDVFIAENESAVVVGGAAGGI